MLVAIGAGIAVLTGIGAGIGIGFCLRVGDVIGTDNIGCRGNSYLRFRYRSSDRYHAWLING